MHEDKDRQKSRMFRERRAGFSSDDFALCLWIVFIVGLGSPSPEGV